MKKIALSMIISILCFSLSGCGLVRIASSGLGKIATTRNQEQTIRQYFEIRCQKPEDMDEADAEALLLLIPQESIDVFQNEYSLNKEQMIDPIVNYLKKKAKLNLKNLNFTQEKEPETYDLQRLNSYFSDLGLDIGKIEEVKVIYFIAEYDWSVYYTTEGEDPLWDTAYLYDGNWYSYSASVFVDEALYQTNRFQY